MTSGHLLKAIGFGGKYSQSVSQLLSMYRAVRVFRGMCATSVHSVCILLLCSSIALPCVSLHPGTTMRKGRQCSTMVLVDKQTEGW